MNLPLKQWSVAAIGALLFSQPTQAQLRITEVMAQASATSSTMNGDWWELTNFGPTPVNLLGYQWTNTEDALPVSDSNFFPSFVLNPGQSLILLEEDAYSKEDWRNMWGIPASIAILTEDEMVDDSTPDGDQFSGLGSGDSVLFYDPAGVLLDSYTYSSSAFVRGTTFEANGHGDDLGLSVLGEFGAIQAANNDIGSPGLAVVPEPTALALLFLGGSLVYVRSHRTSPRLKLS